MERLRPLNIGGLIDAGIKIYTSRWKTLLIAVSAATVPVLLLTALVQVSAGSPNALVRTGVGTNQPEIQGDHLAVFIGSILVVSLLGVVATALASAAAFRSVSGAYLGDDPDWRTSLRFARQRLGSVVWVVVLTSLCTALGVLACGVGALWAMGAFSVAMPVLLVEGQRGSSALGRSWQLVKGRFWPTLGLVLLSSLMTSFVQGAIAAPAIALVFTRSNFVVTVVVQALGNIVGTVLVTPFTAAVTMALYVDLRIRKEGFDLLLLAQRLGSPVPAGGFPAQPGPPPAPAWGPWGQWDPAQNQWTGGPPQTGGWPPAGGQPPMPAWPPAEPPAWAPTWPAPPPGAPPGQGWAPPPGQVWAPPTAEPRLAPPRDPGAGPPD